MRSSVTYIEAIVYIQHWFPCIVLMYAYGVSTLTSKCVSRHYYVGCYQTSRLIILDKI